MKKYHPEPLILFALLTVALYSNAANALKSGTQIKKFSIESTGIVLINSSFSGKRFKRCTGTAISPNMVLTTLSCLYDSGRDELAASASILPHAVQATNHDTPRFFVKRVWFYERALRMRRKNVPFFTIGAESLAVLEIAEEPASQFAVYGYQGRSLSEKSSGKGSGTVIGYSSTTSDPHTMWKHTCNYNRIPGDFATVILNSDCKLTPHSLGSPILNQENYIIGMMIGSLPNSSVFGQIGEMHHQDLTSLTKSKAPSRGMTSIDLKLNRAYQLNLKNACNKKIQAAIKYKGLDGSWHTRGFYNLEPNEGIYNAFKSKNRYFATYAHLYDDPSHGWAGDDPNKSGVVKGSRVNFKQHKVLPKYYADRTIIFNCGD